MRNKLIAAICTTLVMSFTMVSGAQALIVGYTGEVLEASGALATLIPAGTPVEGPIGYDDAQVAGGLVDPSGILSIDVNVGGFCFTTGPDSSGCPFGGASVPVDSIDAAAVTFAAGMPTGGFMDITTFSPSFGIFIPISFDLTAGTFAATSLLGDASGTFAPAVVPLPAAAWLFGSAILGLAGVARRKAKA